MDERLEEMIGNSTLGDSTLDIGNKGREIIGMYDRATLRRAIDLKLLPEGSNVDDLTTDIREKMIDYYILKNLAIRHHYLPEDATIEDLTPGIRYEMSRAGIKLDCGRFKIVGGDVIDTDPPKYTPLLGYDKRK